MAVLRARITFPEKLVKEPVIYNLGRKFSIVTNIRRANIDERFGWVILEMTAGQGELDQGIKYLESLGVRVDPVESDVVEG